MAVGFPVVALSNVTNAPVLTSCLFNADRCGRAELSFEAASWETFSDEQIIFSLDWPWERPGGSLEASSAGSNEIGHQTWLADRGGRLILQKISIAIRKGATCSKGTACP